MTYITQPKKCLTKEGAALFCLLTFSLGFLSGSWISHSDSGEAMKNQRTVYYEGVGYRCKAMIETPAMGIGK